MEKTKFKYLSIVLLTSHERSDREKEYINRTLTSDSNREGIRIQYIAVHTPKNNGVVERKDRSLRKMFRCILIYANFGKTFWTEAVNTANYLQNVLPTRCRDRMNCDIRRLLM